MRVMALTASDIALREYAKQTVEVPGDLPQFITTVVDPTDFNRTPVTCLQPGGQYQGCD
jgi:hypothetical protein